MCVLRPKYWIPAFAGMTHWGKVLQVLQFQVFVKVRSEAGILDSCFAALLKLRRTGHGNDRMLFSQHERANAVQGGTLTRKKNAKLNLT